MNIDDIKIINFELDLMNKTFDEKIKKISRNNNNCITRLDDYILTPNYFINPNYYIRRKETEEKNNIKILSREESIKKQSDYLTEIINDYYKNKDKEKQEEKEINNNKCKYNEQEGANVVSDKIKKNNNIRRFRLIVEDKGFDTIEYIVLYDMSNQKYVTVKDIVAELNNNKREYINFKVEGNKEIIVREDDIIRLEEI